MPGEILSSEQDHCSLRSWEVQRGLLTEVESTIFVQIFIARSSYRSLEQALLIEVQSKLFSNKLFSILS